MCAVPEIASVLHRTGIRFHLFTGFLNDPRVWAGIGDWTAALRVYLTMRSARIGLLGHYYGGMLDVYTDLTKLSGVFGTHMEMLEMCALKQIRDAITRSEIEQKIASFRKSFDVSSACEQGELERAAMTSVAMDKLVEAHALDAVAYYYEGAPGNEYENIVTSIIAGNTLLTGRGISVAGEYEVKNAHDMKIMSAFGEGGSFSEFYLTDFEADFVLLGHDGPVDFTIVGFRVKLVVFVVVVVDVFFVLVAVVVGLVLVLLAFGVVVVVRFFVLLAVVGYEVLVLLGLVGFVVDVVSHRLYGCVLFVYPPVAELRHGSCSPC